MDLFAHFDGIYGRKRPVGTSWTDFYKLREEIVHNTIPNALQL